MCANLVGVAGREAVAAGLAVVPGPGHRDQAEDRVQGLAPVAAEHGLVPVPAGNPVAAVAPVGGQGVAEHDAAESQQPCPDYPLGGFQTGIAAAQGPGGFRGQPGHLGGPLLRERVPEPPFSPPAAEGAPPAAPPGRTGRAEQIAAFTSVSCLTRSRNGSCSATSRRAFSSSGPGLRCTVRVRPSAFRVRFHCGPCPGCPGPAHAQFGFPHVPPWNVRPSS
ncbi:MAG TPA: hypothetical protein VMI73_14415 [Trebonia sp.]|nr:hypothetical protein [Trebonia sp.]